jgi:beta-glucanase (GH16 family)
MTSLGFDAESGFHQYDVEWTPAAVKFIVDGATVRTWSAQIARMKLPQNILFTIWASSSADWAGPISSATIPTTADIDWIKVYSLKN